MKKEVSNMFSQPVIHYNLDSQELVDHAIKLNQGTLSSTGALVVNTGKFTGRSPKDKFIVKDEITADSVDWNNFNIPIEESSFMKLKTDVLNYLEQKEELWIRDVDACASNDFRLSIRVVNENPWSNLFAKNMFIESTDAHQDGTEPDWLILQAPGFMAIPEIHHTRQSNFSVISFKHRTVLIGGTGYTGEIKKGIFSVLNFLLPHQRQVLSMHCSVNVGKNKDAAIFFGLSGTGKTTLSTDPARNLVGDDEHGWGDNEIFNFEGGCYAKVIDLSEEHEPEIFHAIKEGALVENTTFIPGTNQLNYADKSITENTRVSYPLSFIKNSLIPSVVGLPENIFFLTCDAYGVLPPISRLTTDQAMYYFISGYTARIAGTEEGIKEPQATFSACFGAPFLPLHPNAYAKMLGKKIAKHGVKVWMINTGWAGGEYGIGSRIKLSYTRSMINAVLDGSMGTVTYHQHPIFNLNIPGQCPGVPTAMLDPRNTWEDKHAYDQVAKQLAGKFRANFQKYRSEVSTAIAMAGPSIFETESLEK